MTLYKSDLSLAQIEERINSLSEPKFFFTPTNDIIHARLKNNKVIVSGLFYRARGQIITTSDGIEINLKVKHINILTIVYLFSVTLFSMVLFQENVLINGEYATTIERFGFFGLGLLLVTIPMLILIHMKKDFTNKVKGLLDLHLRRL